MKKIATITFHASYNYGSNLQAYALQEVVKRLCENNCEYNIINLRTNLQKDMYKNCFEKSDIKNKLKQILFLSKKKELILKNKYFEEFITSKLNLTKEYNSLKELEDEKFDYDYYIAGSDQLWNLGAKDFDWANYLEFVNKGKKISYAASFGPKSQTWNEEEKNRVKNDLLKFDSISVREIGSFNNVKELTGIEAEINVDPTMLLSKEDWEKLIPKEAMYKGEYIFLYNLKGDEYLKLAKYISKKLNLPIVVSKYGGKSEIIYGFKKRYDVGPIEFLNLIKNASLVLSSSFHGTIFSILLNRPFFALNGNKDFRISTLLEKMGLEERGINMDDYELKCAKAFDINFKESIKLLNDERKKSEIYLKNALDID